MQLSVLNQKLHLQKKITAVEMVMVVAVTWVSQAVKVEINSLTVVIIQTVGKDVSVRIQDVNLSRLLRNSLPRESLVHYQRFLSLKKA